MLKKGKYPRKRRTILYLSIFFTVDVVLLALMSDHSSNVVSTIIIILICSPFWIGSFCMIAKFRKQIRRSDALYNGDLEEALANCADCTEEYALLDKGIFNFSSGRLSLYGDVMCLAQRGISVAYQLWIYENNGMSSFVYFERDEELGGFLEKIRYTHPEITIREKEGRPSKEELDKIARKGFG